MVGDLTDAPWEVIQPFLPPGVGGEDPGPTTDGR